MRPDALTDIIPRERIRYNVSMANYTSFRVGGPADVMILPDSEEELVRSVAVLRAAHIPYHVVGRGTNLLVSDKGIRGVVILLTGGSIVSSDSGLLRADAAVPLNRLYEESAFRGFTGLEFLSGIPGTLGGAVTMNAGAYGREIKDVVASVRMLDASGHITSVPLQWMQFGYRSSVVQKRDLIVLSADLQLERGDVEESRRQAAALRQKRRDKQPLEYPSAGSTFKRPQNGYAGALIEQCGLKGTRVGGAMVSPKHAGFIVNADNASASDIYRLIHDVQNAVAEATGITLDPEVKFLGEF